MKNAPIVEALVDVRISASHADLDERLQRLQERLMPQFATSETLQVMSLSFALQPAMPPSSAANTQLRGFMLRTADRATMLQLRRDGVTVNQLPPYPGWSALRKMSSAWLDEYLDAMQPSLITRVAVRYINQLDFPNPCNLDRFLCSFPKPPPGCLREVKELWSRSTTADAKSKTRVVVTQALQPGTTRDWQTVLFDIDAFRERESGFGRDEVLPTLDELRRLKNKVFFSGITEKTAEKYS